MSDVSDSTDIVAASGLRERKKQETARALALAALRLAVAKGVRNVRVDDIVAECGVSRRTFNNYFPSKEAAIVSLAVERSGRVADAIRERPAKERLDVALRSAYAGHYASGAGNDREQLAKLRVVMAEPSLRGEYLKAMVMAERPLAAAIASRLKSGPVSVRFARVLAAALIAGERVAVRNWLEAQGSISLPDLVREAADQVISGASYR
jgi:AcrR family transcriptional regulator